MDKDSKNNVHQSHRQRVYDRFISEGIESFADHEIIELLLFFAVPRKDVNPIAHRLIDEFGSLSGVLDADIESLEKIDGISFRSAILLNLIPSLLRRYNLDKIQPRSALNSTEKSCEFAKALMIGKSNETCYILCLDNRNHLIKAAFIREGTQNELMINPRSIVESAIKYNASSVILVHNHPRGRIEPSFEDLDCTRKIALALGIINIPLIDHIIVNDSDAFSFKRENIMREISKSVALRTEINNEFF
jgi:DNA repair protein RadC